MNNPYNYTSPITNAADYIGRPSLRAELEAALSSPHGRGLAVSGFRRLGTTSTLHLTMHYAAEKGARCVYIDLRELSQPITSSVLSKAIRQKFDFPADERDSLDLPIDYPALIAVDEFDLIEMPHTFQVIQLLIGYTYQWHQKKKTKVDVCIGSRQTLFEIERAGPLYSPLSASFYLFRLGALSLQEAEDLVCLPSTRSGVSLTPERDRIIQFAGSIPFFLTLACHHAYTMKAQQSSSDLDQEQFDRLESRVAEEAIHTLDGLWRSMTDWQREAFLTPDYIRYRDQISDYETWQLVEGGFLTIDNRRLRHSCELLRSYAALQRSSVRARSKNTVANRGTTVFISYSHADKEWLTRLRVHLAPLDRKGLIEVWDDSKIDAGAQWRHEIEAALTRAKAAVLLISADFLASDFIHSDELPPLLKAAEEGGTVIIAIIVSPCRIMQAEALSKLKFVNAPTEPLTALAWNAQEEIFLRASLAIEEALSIL